MRVSQPPSTGPARFIGGVFGFVFGGIGLTVIGFLWMSRGFEEPPLFFKLVGSFIALTFVAMGGLLFFSSIGKRPLASGAPVVPSHSTSGSGYTCPACGARLGEAADVSPRGDVKCGYCRKWFNVHG